MKVGTNGIYLGKLKVSSEESSKFDYDRAMNRTHTQNKEMGDCVYFMYVDNDLMKIGIAGGKSGWEGRVNMYKNGTTSRGDATNKRIHRVMNKLKKDTIEIYAVPVPRQQVSFQCPVTNTTIKESVEVIRSIEKSLTAKYINSGGELPFCNQLT